MSAQAVRIATRKSPLAMWQAEHVAAALRAAHPGLEVEILGMSTQGDKILDTPLAKIGGTGLFVKELEERMLSDDADIAVHSMKDVPVELPAGLHLSVILEREDPRDAFVSNHHASLVALPEGARVGTSSLRRQCQLADRRPDLEIVGLRGNIAARLARVREHGAIVMAATALDRLGLDPPVVERLDVETFVPQVGQAALAVEIRRSDDELLEIVRTIDHRPTRLVVAAERSFLVELGGDCELPAGAHAELLSTDGDGDPEIRIRGVLASADGSLLQRAVETGPPSVDPGRVLACALRKMLEAAPQTEG